MKQKVALIITGILIGLLGMSQYQSIPLGPFRDTFQHNADREIIVQNLSSEQDQLKKRIAELRTQIKSTHENKNNSEDQVTLLAKLEALNGLTKVKGKGVEIILDDSPQAKRAFLDVNDNSLVHAADLRDIINLLYSYGATAVAINRERIINSSPIMCVGNNILVNRSNLLPPFHIEALGPAETMYINLLNTEKLPALYGRKESYGLEFRFSVKNEIEIPAYGGSFALENIKTVTSNVMDSTSSP